jgi:hypothetical protein
MDHIQSTVPLASYDAWRQTQTDTVLPESEADLQVSNMKRGFVTNLAQPVFGGAECATLFRPALLC